jgi:adenine/guanine/hypoxanthine permease
MNTKPNYPWFVKGDIDGFFGLMVDNLVQLLLIISLCGIIKMPDEFIFNRILPGAAISIIIGNLFYSWQAKKLAEKTGRTDICALPYGINTPSVFAFFFFIILPVYYTTKDHELAWKVGLLACFASGLFEFAGAFIAERIRKITPRAALLSTLAGIAITFIAMDFALKIFEKPLIAMLPMGIILVQYFSRIRFPLGIPGGLLALAVGTALYWALGISSGQPPTVDWHFAPTLPGLYIGDLLSVVKGDYFLTYLSIILPMGIFNVVGSLQNIESAEAAGDLYPTGPCLAVNGIGSMIGACCGSCFPTTIYIGHPGWKGLGARAGYSILNGCFITIICLTGSVSLISQIVPMEAGMAIVVWIGIIITAQAFQSTPNNHAPAVAVGLFPSIAAWGRILVSQSLLVAGTNLSAVGLSAFTGYIAIRGLITLEQGFIFTSMILAAVSVFLIERKFLYAAGWSVFAAVGTLVGIIHAHKITEAGNIMPVFFAEAAREFYPIAIGYLLFAALFLGCHFWMKHQPAQAEDYAGSH